MPIQVKSGVLKGRKFAGLLDCMAADETVQEKCKHRFVRVAEVVSGIACEQPHYTVALVCKRCKKVLESQRVPVTHRLGRLIQRRIRGK